MPTVSGKVLGNNSKLYPDFAQPRRRRYLMDDGGSVECGQIAVMPGSAVAGRRPPTHSAPLADRMSAKGRTGGFEMPYVIKFIADEGTTERRKKIRPVHLEYVIANAHRIIASGGLFAEDDNFPNGGLIILDTDSKQEAIDYIENDPFYLNKIFTTYTLNRFKKAIFDYKRISI
jgi:uncharacterized protein